ncbi:zinc finger and SCAN domain-containing protein 5B isoform X2 [Cricetulus griseus]|uniref:Zinc finger and SCAN domain-containing protein 5B isoform X2 n=1 Tax=Cricetulus griseus TaxID=10029 RepID=A0A9J7H589_CRIGR|nr:zinc finger and SCAN domain-containing protein 5B isoform X2 [Cricetulus griseus]
MSGMTSKVTSLGLQAITGQISNRKAVPWFLGKETPGTLQRGRAGERAQKRLQAPRLDQKAGIPTSRDRGNMATSLPPSEQPPSGEKQNYNPEVWHLRFRGFCPSKRASPDQSLKQISELCYQWLRPDLNSKEEILDQLVLEQFMISMPPQLQALVKESGVTSCKDLEKMLRDHRKPRSWSIVNWKGRLYLRRDPRVEKAEAREDEWDDMKWSQKDLSNQEEPPSRRQGSPALLRNLSSETEVPSTSKALFSQRGFTKTEKAKADEWDDWDQDVVVVSGDSPSSCCSSLELQNLPGTEPSSVRQGPHDVMTPREEAKLDPVTPFTHILEKRDQAASTDPQGLCSNSRDRAPTCRGGASGVDHTENRQLAVAALEHLPGQARFECRECRRSFLYRSQFIIHQRSPTGERPFERPLCNKGFLQSSDLRVHQRTHTGEKPCVCRVWGKVFAHESTLLGHSRVHTKEKPYAFKHCWKCFSHKGNLNVHLRIHSDCRPYRPFRQRHSEATCENPFKSSARWKVVASPPATTTAKMFVKTGGWNFLRCAYLVMTFLFVSCDRGDWTDYRLATPTGSVVPLPQHIAQAGKIRRPLLLFLVSLVHLSQPTQALKLPGISPPKVACQPGGQPEPLQGSLSVHRATRGGPGEQNEPPSAGVSPTPSPRDHLSLPFL